MRPASKFNSNFFFCAAIFLPPTKPKPMFEARLAQGSVLKSVVDAFKDMVTEGTWDCSKKGITMQVRTLSFFSLLKD